MVKEKNLHTFAGIKKLSTILLKQMKSKYFLLTLGIIMNMLLLSSCLGSSDDVDFEYSPDAQIYSFSIVSRTDTNNILNNTRFTIDQVNGRIFNTEPLPYLFHVDSVILNISSASAYSQLSDVTISVSDTADYSWRQTDSVAINKLYRIKTTASDGETTKTYNFSLHTHQTDPYVLSWENVSDGYISSTIADQKTITYNNRFITYFIAGNAVNSTSSVVGDGVNWTPKNVMGLPPSVQLSSLTASGNSLYVIDEDNKVYGSGDGYQWSQIQTEYPIVAIYGVLPSATKGDLLIMVNDNETLKLAETDSFTSIHIMEFASNSNTSTSDLPIQDFSSVSIDNPSSYSMKYIVIAGGNDIWIIQEMNGRISDLKTKHIASGSLDDSSLFFYDQNLYLLINSGGENSLLFSRNFGLEWRLTEENQSLSEDMAFRKSASVLTDEDNYIWIFGGVSETQTQIDDVWRGRINKFAQD